MENNDATSLKCHFGGLAVQIQGQKAVPEGRPGSKSNPKAAEYDVEAVKEASYAEMRELANNRYGTGGANQPDNRQSEIAAKPTDELSKARAKIIDSLRGSEEIIELGDLYPDNRFKGAVLPGAFAPIFFEYILPKRLQPRKESSKEPATKKLYFIYNGKFLIVAALCGPGREVPALFETVSEVCLQMAKSGLEFRWLSPIPKFRSLDLGDVSTVSSPTPVFLNDSVGGTGTMTRTIMRMPRSVQGALRSLYAVSFQYLMSLYSLKEASDTEEALIQTIESQREAVLDLMHEFNQTKARQFLRRRKLRKLIGVHCFNLTEKIGRADALSDSLVQRIASLDGELQHEPDLRVMLEREPSWKNSLLHDFDTKPVLEMITRTSDELSRNNVGRVILWVAVLAAAIGGVAGFFISRII